MTKYLKSCLITISLVFLTSGCRTLEKSGSNTSSKGHDDDNASNSNIYHYSCTCDKSKDKDCSVELKLDLLDDNTAKVALGPNFSRTFTGHFDSTYKGDKDWDRYTGFGPLQDIGIDSDILVEHGLLRGKKSGDLKIVDSGEAKGIKVSFKCKD